MILSVWSTPAELMDYLTPGHDMILKILVVGSLMAIVLTAAWKFVKMIRTKETPK